MTDLPGYTPEEKERKLCVAFPREMVGRGYLREWQIRDRVQQPGDHHKQAQSFWQYLPCWASADLSPVSPLTKPYLPTTHTAS